MGIDAYRENARGMTLGIALALAGLAVWRTYHFHLGLLLVSVGGGVVGFLADRSGLWTAARVGIPLFAVLHVVYLAWMSHSIDLPPAFRVLLAFTIFNLTLIPLTAIFAAGFLVGGAVGGGFRDDIYGD